jgi:hypothetical protein
MRTMHPLPEHDKALLDSVRAAVRASLRAAFIPERPTIRAQPSPDGSVAAYRTFSQLKSRPTVWVDLAAARGQLPLGADLAALRTLLRDAVLREYGHAILEWARMQAPALAAAIAATHPDADGFAGAVADHLNGTAPDEAIAGALAVFVELVFVQDPLRGQFTEMTQRRLKLER